MIEKNSNKSHLKYCEYCGWDIPGNLIKDSKGDKDSLFFCEQCGANLIDNHSNGFKMVDDKNITNLHNTEESKKKSIISQMHRKIHIIPSANYIHLITEDHEFPQIFRENFIIVLSRMIFFNLIIMKRSSKRDISQIKVTTSLIDEYVEILKPITEKHIQDSFLKSLMRISKENFEYWLKKLQSKITSNQIYYKSLIKFLRWLIITILNSIIEFWDAENPPKFESIIINDLKSYYNRKSSHKDRKKSKNLEIKRKDLINIKKSGKLAEFIGIMLGDGHLLNNIIQISFNGVEEAEYIKYVKELINDLFKIKFKEKWERDNPNSEGNEKGMAIYLYDKTLFSTLLLCGLKSGNKVKNAINIPQWIKKDIKWIRENRELWLNRYSPRVIACLKGLTDTDGSIFIVQKRAVIRIEFSNASLPLVKDYKELCSSLGIKTQPQITKRVWENKETGNTSITYKITITEKKQVAKFLLLIQPNKWTIHINKIENDLIKLGSSLKKAFIYQESGKIDYFTQILFKGLRSESKKINYKDIILKSIEDYNKNKRIIIKVEDMKKIYNPLKKAGFTIPKISQIIGVDFRGSLYRGNSISVENFINLLKLYRKYSRKKIPYKIVLD